MTDIEKLSVVFNAQYEAMIRAGTLLAEIGNSRSKYADEAWAAYSQIVNVAHQLNLLMAADAADANRVN